MMIRMISLNTYTRLKAHIVKALPLSNVIIYSLPEGLWVFCITLTSKHYYISLYKRRIDCLFIPIVFCVALEILQLFHLTNGRFDFMDIGVSLVFWILAVYILTDGSEKQDIFTRPNSRMIVCLASYCIVYLAHVFK